MSEALIRAAARNHWSWLTAGAVARGGEVRRERGVRWIAPAAGQEALLLFPRDPSGPAVDAVLAQCRAGGAGSVGCWATGLEPHDALATRLVARGFEWGWRPHWMAIDLDALALQEADPRAVLIDAVPEWDGFAERVIGQRPRRSWLAIARVDGAIAGQAWAYVVGASAGVYDVEVGPPHRRRGLGRALTFAVLRAAANAGARTATLNATDAGELLYRSLGFRSLGWGQTWWLHDPGRCAPTAPELVAAAEAVGRGDLERLRRRPPRAELLHARLASGYNLAHVALHAGHRDLAEWLVQHGAPLDPLLAWDLRGEAGLRAFPVTALQEGETTVLHEAVQRDDPELLRLGLELGVDPAIKDTAYGGTVRGWAEHLGRPDLVAILDAATRR